MSDRDVLTVFADRVECLSSTLRQRIGTMPIRPTVGVFLQGLLRLPKTFPRYQFDQIYSVSTVLSLNGHHNDAKWCIHARQPFKRRDLR